MTTVTKETFWTQIVEDPTLYGTITTDDNLFNYRSDAVWQVMNETFIANGTDFEVSKWEELLGLSSTETILNVRKAVILNHITENLPITVGILEQLVKEITNDDYLLEYNEKENKLFLIIPEETENDIKEIVLRVIPIISDVEYNLPPGYLQAEFIEFTGNTVICISIPVNNSLGLYFDYEKTLPIATNDFPISWQRSNPYKAFRLVSGETSGGFNWWGTSLAYRTPAGYRTLWQANFKNNRIISVNSAEYGYAEKSLPDIDCNYDEVVFGRLWLLDNKLFGDRTYFKSYSIKLSSGSKVVNNLIPAIAPTGEPCMYDKVTRKPFCNSDTGQFIVGMTLEQAQNLGTLPAGGGELTVSLPSNYLEDESVVNALAKAQERSWVITIQTYEVEVGAASTFALKRVWVRKHTDEQGSYVDAEGTRWQMEWCVDIIGADPEQEGYEMFRSVEAAVEYWGLTPWVDPTLEEQFSITNEE